MIVICLEGSHGSGKTSLLQSLMEAGFNVLDEAFINQPSYTKDLHPQSLTMESMWVCRWFERLLKKKSEIDVGNANDTIFFADRSPYSAVFYSKGDMGKLLSPVIKQQVIELQQSANIEVITVYVQVQPDVLWDRIQQRLRREPSREKFSENKIEWMQKTLQFYDNFKWDCSVDNSHAPVEIVMEKLVATISRRSQRFRRIVSSEHVADAKLGAASPDDLVSPILSAASQSRSNSPVNNFSPRVRAASRQCLELEAELDGGKSRTTSFDSTPHPNVPIVTPGKQKRVNGVEVSSSDMVTPEQTTKTEKRLFSPDTVVTHTNAFAEQCE